MAYRFRDVYDHVVRVTDEAVLFQDRVTGILEVNLASISNRLNQVMKVLTVMSTIFLPLTVLTGMWGMNVAAAAFSGRRGRAVLVDRRRSWPRSSAACSRASGGRAGSRTRHYGKDPSAARRISPTRSPPAKSSSVRRR